MGRFRKAAATAVAGAVAGPDADAKAQAVSARRDDVRGRAKIRARGVRATRHRRRFGALGRRHFEETLWEETSSSPRGGRAAVQKRRRQQLVRPHPRENAAPGHHPARRVCAAGRVFDLPRPERVVVIPSPVVKRIIVISSKNTFSRIAQRQSARFVSERSRVRISLRELKSRTRTSIDRF